MPTSRSSIRPWLSPVMSPAKMSSLSVGTSRSSSHVSTSVVGLLEPIEVSSLSPIKPWVCIAALGFNDGFNDSPNGSHKNPNSPVGDARFGMFEASGRPAGPAFLGKHAVCALTEDSLESCDGAALMRSYCSFDRTEPFAQDGRMRFASKAELRLTTGSFLPFCAAFAIGFAVVELSSRAAHTVRSTHCVGAVIGLLGGRREQGPLTATGSIILPNPSSSVGNAPVAMVL
mmetsp:Transcript_15095/g.28555  ORF Transcript_15095/g.28555 Transcript_15095/m.28555 type:complete len:230 (+) Transcript_15095:572-1261(+)